jgi:erythromycin esterase-like protein
MWRNTVVHDFIEWLREHNDMLEPEQKVGFYGLDLYSLHASMKAVIEYLRATDPHAAKRAEQRYSCFDQYGNDPQIYGYQTSSGMTTGCEAQVIRQLLELLRNSQKYEDPLWLVQNAAVVKGAENYYRAMFTSSVDSWNIRDEHMTDTLDTIAKHFGNGSFGNVVVWEHNSHLGDARETERTKGGKWNVGQLARERFGTDIVFNIGFTTYTGTVTAADDWGTPAQLKKINPGLPGSFETLFHATQIPNFMLLFRGELSEEQNQTKRLLENTELLERAIGVVYRPKTERMSHYLNAKIARQFDAVIHMDFTSALVPLDRNAEWLRAASHSKQAS